MQRQCNLLEKSRIGARGFNIVYRYRNFSNSIKKQAYAITLKKISQIQRNGYKGKRGPFNFLFSFFTYFLIAFTVFFSFFFFSLLLCP